MHQLTLLTGGEFLSAVLHDIERAHREVLVECYIVLDDEVGGALGDALARAASRGVVSRLLFDPLGSKKASMRFFRGLHARGVEVRAWRRILTIPGIRHLAPRDHSRAIVVDDVAYTGGAAFSRQWLPRDKGGEGWRDACVRLEGPGVADLRDLFRRRWDESHDSRAAHDLDTKGRYPDIRIIADTPDRHSPLYDAHREVFAAARRRIWMANSYFAPPRRMFRVLADAAARSVDVRVILPAVSDLPLLKLAALARVWRWLGAGVRVFEYLPAMFHSKYTIVDDDLCSIGTFNYNSASVGLANELNVLVRERGFIASLAAMFEQDLQRCGA
ncbi:MAG TPA: phosphatidylserine/phosphatidylglycerophosphate/cardiolipin synthase family protein, partial [Myxococcales bacterium]|nr:phosphatidylserine/phosphatidylglycerophosphate/cardiolipin synthase family protein [Myxococcales bacterium]